MNELQAKLVEELGWLTDFCDQNNVSYFVIGGTLLGAARHKGFIPWDNDIDVGFPRPDYERVIQLLKEQKSKYVIETCYSDAPDYLYKFSKLYDTTTTVIEDTRRPCKRGTFIDIIPLDGIGNSRFTTRFHFLPIYILNTLLTANAISERPDRPKWLNWLSAKVAGIPKALFNEKKLLKKLDRMCKKRSFSDCKYVGVLNGGYGLRDIVERRIFEEKDVYDFEYLKVKSVRDYDSYLTHLYGDWRKIPPPEKRKSDHEYSFVDLNKSYLD
jgi:lipopolysaccharide cholinephosphotransferase